MVHRKHAFTLLELMVVTTLIGVAVGMAVFRLDGLTDGGRLQSVAMQLSSFVRLAQTEARASGSPRLVEYNADGESIVIRRPRFRGGGWEWGDGLAYDTAGSVHIKRVLLEGDEPARKETDGLWVRIGPDGRMRSHAVVLELHDRWAVLICHAFDEADIRLISREPVSLSFDLLTLELEHMDETG